MSSDRALAYVRSRAEQQMSYLISAETVGRPGYDETTLEATAGTRTHVYTGIARIWEVTGASTIAIGESDVDIQSTQLSLPWDAPLLPKNAEIEVLSASADAALVGKRFQVQSSAKAGEMRATRRYAVTAVN